MVEVMGAQRQQIVPFFQGWEETMVWSVLQNCMGRAWTDSLSRPQAALLGIGDFFFFSGDSRVPGAWELATAIPRVFPGKEALLVPRDHGWQELVEAVFPGQVEKSTRYAIRKEPDVFDRKRLLEFRGSLPEGFALAEIDRALYEEILSLSWARDFCALFGSWEAYRDHGCGFVALRGDEIAAGASSFTWYRGGIEIEIDTKTEYRRQGLARCCASALILRCLEQGLYPSWDAATPISVALAEQLGYHFSHTYPCYLLSGGEMAP